MRLRVVCETLLPLESEKAIFMTTRSFRARIATLGFERIREPVRTLPFGDRQKLSCRFFVPALFCWFSLSIFGESTSAQERWRAKTKVSIVEDAFHINGKPTYAGQSWKGTKIEGLLLNSRMVQATFDDLNSDTRETWAYPDTNVGIPIETPTSSSRRCQPGEPQDCSA